MRRILFLAFYFVTTTAFAQSTVRTPSSFGYEVMPWLILPTITGDNTEATAGLSYGVALVGVVQFDISSKISIETGIQLGFTSIKQTVIERDVRISGPDNILREVEVESANFHTGIPLFVKVTPTDWGGYLKLGGRGLLNFSSSEKGKLIGPNNFNPGDEPVFPAGEVIVPDFSFVLEAGIGYKFYGRNGRASYLELNVGRPLGPVIENAGPRDAVNRLNYLDTTNAVNIGLTLGVRFGR